MLVYLSDATLGPSAYADCVSTVQTAIAIRSCPVWQELLTEKISTIVTFMKHKKGERLFNPQLLYQLQPRLQSAIWCYTSTKRANSYIVLLQVYILLVV